MIAVSAAFGLYACAQAARLLTARERPPGYGSEVLIHLGAGVLFFLSAAITYVATTF